MKQFVRKAIDKFGVETNRSITLQRFFSEHNIDHVIDAGANIGQFGQLISGKRYKNRIWSFEPVSSVFLALQDVSRGSQNWNVGQFALGQADGTLEINVPSNHSLSSFLRPSALMASYDNIGDLATETVQIKRLDDVLRNDPAKKILLKADVQGFEKQVLEGATGILN